MEIGYDLSGWKKPADLRIFLPCISIQQDNANYTLILYKGNENGGLLYMSFYTSSFVSKKDNILEKAKMTSWYD